MSKRKRAANEKAQRTTMEADNQDQKELSAENLREDFTGERNGW